MIIICGIEGLGGGKYGRLESVSGGVILAV
jgi:hypothetical protein